MHQTTAFNKPASHTRKTSGVHSVAYVHDVMDGHAMDGLGTIVQLLVWGVGVGLKFKEATTVAPNT